MSEYAKRTTIYTNIDSDDDTDAAAAQRHYRVVLCGSNAYDKKYYINPKFSGLPETVKEELRIICCLFTEEVGGVFTVNLTPGGEVVLESEADEDELEEWDAHDLDELPLRCDFEEGFAPYSPFDEGWQLVVQFPRPDEMEDAYLEEPEARETLTELLQAANGDYSVVDDYVSRCSDLYTGEGSLADLALEIAQSLGTDDYSSVCCNE